MPVFVLDGGLSPRELLSRLREAFTVELRESPMEILTYRDTFDWRFHNAGLTLTTAPSGRKIRVSLRSTSGEVAASESPRIPSFASDIPHGPTAQRVGLIGKRRRIFPKAWAEWRTSRIAILNEDAKTVVRLRLREGTVSSAQEELKIPLPPRLECLPLKGYGSEEKRVEHFLRKGLGLRRDNRTDLEVVYAATGRTPGDYSPAIHLSLEPGMAAAEAAREVHLTLLKTILANLDGVSKDWDAEFLHDFRVAIRRTRAALTQLKGVFPAGTTAHFSEEFRWLGARTGLARDMDVYLLEIPSYRAALPRGTDRDLEPLARLLQGKKRVELRRLRACLRSQRFRRLIDEWQAFLHNPLAQESPPRNADRPILELASGRICKAFEKVLKKGGKIDEATPAKALHRLRIRCKKLRYLLTFFRSLFPAESIDPLIQELKQLQDHLGDFNDLQVQQEALRSFAEEIMDSKSGPPSTLMAMGQLMGQLEGAQAREREAFHHHYQQFSRPKNQKRFRETFGSTLGADTQPLDRGKNR